MSGFFNVLGQDGGDAAMDCLRSSAFDQGLDQAPSPRAEQFFSEGEWMEGNTMVPLVPIRPGESCFGQLIDVTKGAMVLQRFCGKTTKLCNFASHQKQQVDPRLRKPGWYISLGGRQSGVLLNYRFPFMEDGGPIGPNAVLRLVDPQQEFKMAPGQWMFVHSEWMESQVMSLSSGSWGNLLHPCV